MPTMPGDLILTSLAIQRFRCFRELRIGRLGRVNLIVGKNNVGKSTILEALRLFASPGSFTDLLATFASRNEISGLNVRHAEYDVDDLPYSRLFFGRVATISDSIQIGPVDSPESMLTIFITFIDGFVKNIDLNFTDIHRTEVARLNRTIGFMLDDKVQILTPLRPALYRIHRSGAVGDGQAVTLEPIVGTLRGFPCHTIGSNGLGLDETEELWNDVSLSPLKDEVIAAIRITYPEVEDVALRTPDVHPRFDRDRHEQVHQVPFARVENFSGPVPLRSLGDGVNRFFSIALALAHAKGGLLLVDEVENGIHYTAQVDLWHLIFKTAARLNVQVFATTHSYDCIKAFEEAARESEEEGVLVRLARNGDRTLVGEFDERELEIAVEGDIEVR
jgi:ABC-type dipeptide/oligopeptide/nickel transport system ATPase component